MTLEMTAAEEERSLCHLRDILRSKSSMNPSQGWYSHGPAQLLHHLYLGDYSDANSVGLLKELGITHILNCAGAHTTKDKSPLFCRAGNNGIIVYRQFEADDSKTYEISQHFEEATQFIDAAKDTGGKVLVYCARGMNRSAAICVAYMMTKRKTKLLETVRNVKNLRGKILSNTAFQKQLIREFFFLGRFNYIGAYTSRARITETY